MHLQYGQLGRGDKTNVLTVPKTDTLAGVLVASASPSPSPSSMRAASALLNIATGMDAYHNCIVVASTGGLRCWGGSVHGEVPGSVDPTGQNFVANTAVPVSDTLTGVAEATLGLLSTCIRMVNGSVRCWGMCMHGQCGANTTTDITAVPIVDVPNLPVVRSIQSGPFHTCAIVDAPGEPPGGLRCWGLNSNGQLGQGPVTVNGLVPPATSAVTGVVMVSLQSQGTCILLNTTGVKCFGSNNHNALGAGPAVAEITAIPTGLLATGVSALTTVCAV